MQDTTSKQLGADALSNLVDALSAYLDEENTSLQNASLPRFLEWATDGDVDLSGDTVEVGGVEIPLTEAGREGGDENGEAQANKEADDSEAVEAVRELRADLEQAGVLKSEGGGEDETGVIRRVDKLPSGEGGEETAVAKSNREESEEINLSFEGITDAN